MIKKIRRLVPFLICMITIPCAALETVDVIEETGEDTEISFSTHSVTAEDIYAIKLAVKQAQFLYEEALMYYEQGNKRRAGLSFEEALNMLREAQIDTDTQYMLKDSMANLFADIDKALTSNRATGESAATHYEVLIDTGNELAQKYLKLYTQGKPKELITKALERSGRYRAMILDVLAQYGLPRELVYLPIVESLYNNNDLSRAGALGIWQIMPERARALGLKVNHWVDERKDPEKATRAAAQYLKELHTMFDDWHLALAAYNRGEFGLARDLKFSKATNIEQMKERHAVPRETSLYVPQFIACTIIGDHYKDYGFDVTFDLPTAHDDVVIDKIIDLDVIAKCANTNTETIRGLNPSLHAWCTPYNYPNFTLHLPAGTKDMFLAKIAEVKDLNPSNGVIRYKVVKGDYLGKIAKKFGTSVSSIMEDNRVKNAKALRIGQTLMIRPGRKYAAKQGKN